MFTPNALLVLTLKLAPDPDANFLTPRTVPAHGTSELMSSSHVQNTVKRKAKYSFLHAFVCGFPRLFINPLRRLIVHGWLVLVTKETRTSKTRRDEGSGFFGALALARPIQLTGAPLRW